MFCFGQQDGGGVGARKGRLLSWEKDRDVTKIVTEITVFSGVALEGTPLSREAAACVLRRKQQREDEGRLVLNLVCWRVSREPCVLGLLKGGSVEERRAACLFSKEAGQRWRIGKTMSLYREHVFGSFTHHHFLRPFLNQLLSFSRSELSFCGWWGYF